MLPTRQQALQWIGKPVGITFKDGTGVSGVLCVITENTFTLREFQINNFFPLKTYQIRTVKSAFRFPGC